MDNKNILGFPFRNIKDCRVSSAYGVRIDPITHKKGVFHQGMDIVSYSDITVISVCDGVVKLNKSTGDYGIHVDVKLDDKSIGGYILYGHLKHSYVKVGDRVKKGDKIGIMGSTGRSTAAHLHIEWRNVMWTPAKRQDISKMFGIKNITCNKGEIEYLSPEYDDWEAETLDKLVKEELINSPEYWLGKWNENCTIKDMVGFVGELTLRSKD